MIGLGAILGIIDALSGVLGAVAPGKGGGGGGAYAGQPGLSGGTGTGAGGSGSGVKIADESQRSLAQQIGEAVSKQVLTMKGTVTVTGMAAGATGAAGGTAIPTPPPTPAAQPTTQPAAAPSESELLRRAAAGDNRAGEYLMRQAMLDDQPGRAKPPGATPPPPAPTPTPPAAPNTPPTPKALPFPVPLPVSVTAPLPVPVVMPAAPPGGAPAGGTAAPTPGLPAGGGVNLPSPDTKKLTGGLGEVIDTMKRLSTASAAAFGAISAGLTGLVAAASPATFQTLTGSLQILAATLGGALVGPIATVAWKIQDLANWIRQLDPQLKGQIATWTVWGAGALGTVAVLGKLVGMVQAALPVLGALRVAMSFTIGNPFGALLAGLAAVAVFKPSTFAGLGDSISNAFSTIAEKLGPVLQVATEALASFANAASAILGPALSAVAGIIGGLSSAIGGIAGLFGSTSGQVIAMGAAFYMLLGPMRMLVSGISTAIASIQAMSAAMSLAGGAVAFLKAQWIAMTAAMAANPIGLIAIAAAAAIVAVLALTGAFSGLGAEVERVAKRVQGMQAAIDKINEDKDVTKKDLKSVLTHEENVALEKAKTPEERKKVLEKAQKDAEAQGKKFDKEKRDLVEAKVAKALEDEESLLPNAEGAGPRARRLKKIRKALVESGVREEDVDTQMEKFKKNFPMSGLGDSNVPEDVKAKVQAMIKDAFSGSDKSSVIGNALQSGVGGTVPADPTKAKAMMIEEFQKSHPRAFHKEGTPARMGAEDVRGVVQNNAMGKSPIEQTLLEIERQNDANLEKKWLELMAKMESIDKSVGR